jgi:hypothetical protein
MLAPELAHAADAPGGVPPAMASPPSGAAGDGGRQAALALFQTGPDRRRETQRFRPVGDTRKPFARCAWRWRARGERKSMMASR